MYIYSEVSQKKLIYGYFAGITITLLVYFDSWPHHVVTLAPFLIFFILLEKDFKMYKFFKIVYYLIAFLILAFWIIFYLTYEYFPLNLGGLSLIILIYYTLTVYYVSQVKFNSKISTYLILRDKYFCFKNLFFNEIIYTKTKQGRNWFHYSKVFTIYLIFN